MRLLSLFHDLDKQRRRLLERVPPGPLADYLAVPFPDRRMPLYEAPILSLDLETTGLRADHDDILSVGHVTLQHQAVDLGTCYHRLVRSGREIPEESAIIHRITDDLASQGETIRPIVEELLQRLAGKVLLAHHAGIERSFIQAVCRRLYGEVPVFAVIDTLQIAREWFDRRNMHYGPGELRLYALRKQYGLPRYPAHDALSDALATAELFLAQVDYIGDSRKLPLKRFLSR